jgi:hypothetical protein
MMSKHRRLKPEVLSLFLATKERERERAVSALTVPVNNTIFMD